MVSNVNAINAITKQSIMPRHETEVIVSETGHGRPLLGLLVIPVVLLCTSVAAGLWHYKKRSKKRLEKQKADDAAERVRSRQAWLWLAEERMVQEDRANALAMLEGRIPENTMTVRAYGY